jgi:hypothetical protein
MHLTSYAQLSPRRRRFYAKHGYPTGQFHSRPRCRGLSVVEKQQYSNMSGLLAAIRTQRHITDGSEQHSSIINQGSPPSPALGHGVKVCDWYVGYRTLHYRTTYILIYVIMTSLAGRAINWRTGGRIYVPDSTNEQRV